jgi:hypothetical protein
LIPLIASLGNITTKSAYRTAILAVGFCLIIITALPGLYPLPWESGFDTITHLDYIEAEAAGRWRGTTSTNDFVPSTVMMIPNAQDAVLASYRNPPIDRVNRYTLPQSTTVKVLESKPWHNHFEINTTEKFILRLYLFYFPGWTAYLNNVQVPIEIANPEGFITVEIPPGNHEVKLQFEDTFPRKLGWGIAILGLFILSITMLRFPIDRATVGEVEKSYRDPSLRYLAGAIIALVLFKALIIDPLGWLHYESPQGKAQVVQTAHYADFGGEIALLGFDLSRESLKAGDRLDITLYWNAQHPLTETYQSFVHIVHAEAQSDHLNPGGFPTNLWEVERYVRDTHKLELPADMPPGENNISIGLYTLHNGVRLPVLADTQGGARGDHLILSRKFSVRD